MDKIRNEGPPIKTKLPNFAQINTSQISRLKQRLNSIRKEKSLATIFIVIGIATTINIIGLDLALAIIAVASIASCALLAEKI